MHVEDRKSNPTCSLEKEGKRNRQSKCQVNGSLLILSLNHESDPAAAAPLGRLGVQRSLGSYASPVTTMGIWIRYEQFGSFIATMLVNWMLCS